MILGILAAIPDISYAQTVNFDFGEEPTLTASLFRIIALVTILSLAPSILMMMTSFTRIIVVLSLLRNALGTQQTPPNAVLISLALFLTFFIMQPVFEQSYYEGIKPLINEELEEDLAIERIARPFHQFMMKHAREKDIVLFLSIVEQNDGPIEIEEDADVPYRALIPAFMISELRRAFEIGFLVFIPFLIIDMVIASVLMSMGMMMLPPVLISLPFKVIFFVLIDGWAMLSESLIKSFT
jgi:flagellar biosynthetic protein FliP